MANAPADVLKQWKYVEENGITCPPEFWEFWEVNWLPTFNYGKDLIQSSAGNEMSVSKGLLLNSLLKDLHHFSDSFRNSNNGKFDLQRDIRDLITHHINNDLHVCGFAADISSINPEPIPKENVIKLLEHFDAMAACWDRLKKIKKGG